MVDFFISEENKDYCDPQWWDKKYSECTKEDEFEWFTGTYDEDFINLLVSLIPSKESKIVHLGVGISRIQEAIFDQGYKNITNNDISEKCIQLMKEKDTRGMNWDVVDILKTFPYEDGSFDVALDKGTLDALILEKADKWELDDEAAEISLKYFKEVCRVLKPGGIFIQISFGQPHFRKRLFEREELNWNVSVKVLQPKRSFHFFVYVCQKN